MDFTQTMRLRGKAEEDIYFAKLDRQLIEAMHEKQKQAENMSDSVDVDAPVIQTTMDTK